MPVKIIDATGTTSTSSGEITKDDLGKMKSDFDNEVEVSPKGGRVTVIKKTAFYFSKYQLQKLFDTAKDAEFVKINIGVQIQGTLDICKDDESNSLSAVVEMARKGIVPQQKISLNDIGDFVLINGYQDNGPEKLAGGCCPSSDPPRNN
jgi:hypothetical protein